MPARIIHFSIEIPAWLDGPAVVAVLLYRRLRYGYAFRRIPLSRGEHAIVDPDDYAWLSQYNWHVSGSNGSFYAVRNTGQRRGQKRVAVKMHREILRVPDGMFVDHINHNGLDNRKANLRPATQAQNARNRRKRSTSKVHSKYKGLTWYKSQKRWAVRIMVDRKSKFIGYFDNELDAAKAYDMAAKKYHGQFAGLNFPDETADLSTQRAAGSHALTRFGSCHKGAKKNSTSQIGSFAIAGQSKCGYDD